MFKEIEKEAIKYAKENCITTNDKLNTKIDVEYGARWMYSQYCISPETVKEMIKDLRNAMERMERARNILKRDSDGNWGMLDTSDLKSLSKADKELNSK